MKKILVILNTLDPGGAETFIMKIFRCIDNKITRIDFCVAYEKEGIYEEEIRKKGSIIFHITPKSLSFKKYFFGLLHIFRYEKYNIVLRLGTSCFSSIDLWIAYFCGVKIRAMRACSVNFEGSKLHKILHNVFRHILFYSANIKIAPSTEAGKFVFGEKYFIKNKVNIIPNGVDLLVYKYSEQGRNRVLDELNIVDKFVVGHIGRFRKEKNHDFLISVFFEIKKLKSNAILLLVGDGELVGKIKEKALKLNLLDSIRFVGIRSDIPDLLSAMDIFVFTSKYEGMPNSVIEAQAIGLKCFVADTITREVNITGNVTFLPLCNPFLWAKRIIGEINVKNNEYLKSLIKNGYDIHDVSKNIIRLISD